MLDEMKRLVREKDVCVLATASGNRPHCSLMAYVCDENCGEIYMVTYRDSTKYRNLSDNPAVSLLVDTREEHLAERRPEAKALTVEGTYEEINDSEKRARVREKLLARHPHLMTFLDDPAAVVFAVKIASFLLLDGLTQAHFETVSSGREGR
jgi:nitroimidazol reductase NimA-like FMN-containing flavoprotein (pyridoxamine 5'-phosphate oxidase superfamily)